ncbi:MAG: cation diffusion facilitator family transporter [Fidelibacterota bacterium]
MKNMEEHKNPDNQNIHNIKLAFILNLTFTFVEIIGGLWTNSIAIVSDALHDLGDSLSLGLSWYLERLSGKKRDHRFSFGYRRFSLLAALINSIVLIVGSVLVLLEAVPRMTNPETVKAEGMLYLSILGIIVNGIAAWRLKGGKTLNERVVTWHLLEDVLGWVAVFIISVLMLLWTLPILDPILSILITVFILWNVTKRLKETARIFLQAIPPGIDINKLENGIIDLENVISVHDTHVWSLDGEYMIMSTHVVVPNDIPANEYIQIKNIVKNVCHKVNIQHITIEIEKEEEYCEMTE